MHVGDRIDKVMKDRGYTKNSLAKAIGIHPSTLNNWITNSTVPDSLKLDKLCEVLDVSKLWILSGLLDSEPRTIKSNATKAEFKTSFEVPLISQYAYAGYLSGFSDPEYLDKQPTYTVKHDHNGGHYIAFEVRGDSMDDNSRKAICGGDIVLGCELKREYWKDNLFIPKVFIIVHRDNGIVIKEVIAKNNETGMITCHSWNPSPEYHNFEIHMNDIQQMFYIKEISRSFKL